MRKIKRTLAAATGIIVGAVTLRKLRKRRQKTVEKEATISPKEEAAEEAKAAAAHARAAGEKASKFARKRAETVQSR